MQFHRMQSPHLPYLGIYGDCWRTAVACVLDMHPKDVPHWMQLYPPKDPNDTTRTPERDKAYREFLKSRGLSEVSVPYQVDRENLQLVWDSIAAHNGEDIIYLVCGKSPTGPHIVVHRGRKLLWDPSPTDAGIVDSIDGHIWVSFFIPLFMRCEEQVQLELHLPQPSKLLQGSIPEDNDE